MKKIVIQLVFILALITPSVAQKKCNEYRCMIERVDKAIRNKEYNAAFKDLEAAAGYSDSKADEVAKFRKRLFDAIQKEKDEAKRQKERADHESQKAYIEATNAENQKKQAEFNLMKANKLISYFGFNDSIKTAWVHQDGKFAIIDRAGDLIKIRDSANNIYGDFIFTEPEPFKTNGVAIAQIDGFYHFVESNGNISPPFNFIFPCNNGWYKVNYHGEWYFSDFKGRLLSNQPYESIGNFYNKFSLVQSQSKWGWIDSNLNVIVTPKYEDLGYDRHFDQRAYFPFNNRFLTVKYNNKWGIINDRFIEIAPPKYERIGSNSYRNDCNNLLQNGYEVIKLNNKYGIIDSLGREIISPKYSEIEIISRNYIAIKDSLKWGLIELEKDKVIINPIYDKIVGLQNGFIAVSIGDITSYHYSGNGAINLYGNNCKIGILNRTGKLVIEPQFNSLMVFENGFYCTKDSNKVILIDTFGNKKANSKFDIVSNFKDGFAYIKKDDKWGIIDSKFNVIITPKYEQIGDNIDYFGYEPLFINRLAVVKKESKCGIVNDTGIEIIPCIYDDIKIGFQGYFFIKKINKWSIIDSTSKEITIGQFEDIYPFENHIKFQLNGRFGLIDKKFIKIVPPIYDDITDASDNIFSVKQNDKWGYINVSGKVIVKPQFSDAGRFNEEGKAEVTYKDTKLLINKRGEIFITN